MRNINHSNRQGAAIFKLVRNNNLSLIILKLQRKILHKIENRITKLGRLKESNANLLEQDKKENRCCLRALPTFVGLGTDEICNLRCVMCIQRTKEQSVLKNSPPIEEKYFIKFANQVFPTAKILRLNTSGEPLMSRRLELEAGLAEKYGVRLELITNGTLLNVKRKLFEKIVNNSSSISFSFDSPIKKTYESIRIGAEFLRVVENMRLFQKYRNTLPIHKRPFFYVNMVLMRRNFNEIIPMVNFTKSIGEDCLIIVRILVSKKEMQDESLDNCREETNRALLEAQEFAKKLNLNLWIPPLFNIDTALNSEEDNAVVQYSQPKPALKRCPFLWDYVYIDGNADIFTCCEPSHPVAGSIKDRDFRDIWNNQLYQKMRSTFTGGAHYKLCKDCAEHGYLSEVNL